MDEENYFEYCPFCGYDLIIRSEVFVDGIKMLRVDCNECGTFLGYEDIE